MVGVPGRSKGCDNCRRRHLKCNLQRPQCGPCIKSRLECGGPRGLAFVVYEGDQRCDIPKNQTGDESRNSVVIRNTTKVIPANFNVILSLPLSRDEIFTAFTHCNLLPENGNIVVPNDVNRTITGKSFLALSYTYFGVKHHDKYITQDGLQQYGRALIVLNGTLAKAHAAQSFDVLESIMIMAMIEFLISDREDGWVNHARGLERLLELRGAGQMMTLPCLMILEQTRSSIVFAAIVLHKPTILAKPEWKTEPWRLHPERIDYGKKLFDILCDCPELFVLRDQLSTGMANTKRTTAVQMLIAKARQILYDLEQWSQEWAFDPTHVCIEVTSPLTTPTFVDPSGQDIPIWATILQYESLHHSNAVTMYNGALVLVLRFILGLDMTMSGYRDTEYLQARLCEAGIIICRSVEYHYRQLSGEQGGFFLLFPLRMAYDAVGRSNPAIGTWLKGVLNDIATGRRGMWKSARTLLEIGS